MPSSQKQKGSGYEREVAKYLSDLYQESFIRAPGSGAYIGGKNTDRKQMLHEGQIRNFKGDVVPGPSFINLNIECKFYSDFPWHQLLSGQCKLLDSWIDQLMSVADINDLSILFMKFNRKGSYVCVPSNFTWISDNFIYYTTKNHNDWLIFELETFFKNNQNLVKTYSSPNNTKDTKSIKNIVHTTTNFIN